MQQDMSGLQREQRGQLQPKGGSPANAAVAQQLPMHSSWPIKELIKLSKCDDPVILAVSPVFPYRSYDKTIVKLTGDRVQYED